MKKRVVLNAGWKSYAIIFLFTFISGLSLTYAYGGTSPAVMGHNLAEVGIPTCADSQVLSYSNGNLICSTLPPQSNTPIYGTGATMNLPGTGIYTVTGFGIYATCMDSPSKLKLDALVVGSYTGLGDQDGCDQNTVMGTIYSVPAGTHVWTITSSYSSQHAFVWIANKV